MICKKKTFITLTMLGESLVSQYHCHYLSDNKPKITQASCLLPLSSFNYRNGFCCFPFITIRKKNFFSDYFLNTVCNYNYMQGVEYMKTNFAKACFLQCIFCLTKIYPDAGIVRRYALITQNVILVSIQQKLQMSRAFQNISNNN